MKHLDGAAKLLEARGPEQLTRPGGLEMFIQLRAQIVSWQRVAGSPTFPPTLNVPLLHWRALVDVSY